MGGLSSSSSSYSSSPSSPSTGGGAGSTGTSCSTSEGVRVRRASWSLSSSAGTCDSGIANDAASERGARGDSGGSDLSGNGGAGSSTGGAARGVDAGRDGTGEGGDTLSAGAGYGVGGVERRRGRGQRCACGLWHGDVCLSEEGESDGVVGAGGRSEGGSGMSPGAGPMGEREWVYIGCRRGAKKSARTARAASRRGVARSAPTASTPPVARAAARTRCGIPRRARPRCGTLLRKELRWGRRRRRRCRARR